MARPLLILLVLLLCAPWGWGQAAGERAAAASALVEALARGEFERVTEALHPEVRETLPVATLGQVWEGLVAQVGAFLQVAGMRPGEPGAGDVVFVVTEFERATLDVRLAFDAAGRVVGINILPSAGLHEWTPPDYVAPEAFEEREVVVGQGEWALPGTLAMPTGEGPFPGLVLVHGSGPQDRDESLGPNKPLRDLAWGLASRDIAVLRYEKRTREHGGKMGALADTLTVQEETVDDALAAAALLRATDGVDPRRVFVLGHSLGGMLIPRIGGGDPELAGLIVLAGTTRPLEDVVLEQVEYLTALAGDLTEEARAAVEQIRAQVARVKDPGLSPVVPADQLPLGTPAAYWLDLRGYEPAQAARELPQPMLVIHGGRDYQVTMDDFRGWQDGMADRADVTFKLYPTLNHLMIAGEGVCSPAEYFVPGHVDAAVVEDIAEWIAGVGGTQ